MPTAIKETVLIQALEAAVTGDVSQLDQTFTEDVVGWSPNLSVSSRDELAEEFDDRHDALSNIVISFDAVYIVGDHDRRMAGRRGPHRPSGDRRGLHIEPSGRRRARRRRSPGFRGDQICAFRNYFDDAALLEQLLLSD